MTRKLLAREGDVGTQERLFRRAVSGSVSLFANPKFLAHGKARGSSYLQFTQGGDLLGQFSMVVCENADGSRTLRIPGSASYAELLTTRKISLSECEQVWLAVRDYAREIGCSSVKASLIARQHGIEVSDELEFAALRAGYVSEIVGIESVVLLPAVKNSKAHNILKKCRENGLTFHENIGVSNFYPLLSETYRRHGSVPTHSESELNNIISEHPEQIRIVGVYLDGQLAAAACLFRISILCELVFYLATSERHKALNPQNFLIWEDMAAAHSRGVQYYNFGTSSIALDLREGVYKFKGQFGAVGYLRRCVSTSL